MKATGHSGIAVVLGVLLITSLIDCGGKTDDDSKTGSGAGGNKGSGGISAAGGNTAVGGTSMGGSAGSMASGGSHAGASPVAPRVPAVHRADALLCVGVFSPPEPIGVAGAGAGYNQCTKHADCTDGVNGKCTTGGAGRTAYQYSCYYDRCATDADCAASKICYCTASSAARCLSVGNCRTDADCGGGAYSYCSPSMSWDCAGYRPIDGHHCHTAADSCIDDKDCTGNDYCNFDVYEARWKCVATNTMCAIG